LYFTERIGMVDHLIELAQQLRERGPEIAQQRVVAGFDGFVDEFIRVVDERKGLDSFTPVATIEQFGAMLSAASGRSSLREIVVTEVAAGGCSVNLGDGLLSYGLQLDYFGTVGWPVHKAFETFAGRCRSCQGWACDPGHTLALEFQDGKYMLSSVSQLADFTPDALRAALADGAFAQACSQAGALAFTNWTLYPHMTDCWRVVQEEVIQHLPNNPWVFIDLVDPRSRSDADIEAMLEVLVGFERGARLVFGGNLNEANVLSRLLGLPENSDETGAAVAAQAAAIREKLGVSQVAIHCIPCAAVASADGAWSAPGPTTPTPRRSTGAGDRYNAGYLLGLLLQLPPEQCLLLGNATSGFFVRQARSGTVEEIADLLESWAEGTLAD
jgi:hypothetical protein